MAKGKVQINEASRDELAALPGIGPAMADTLIKLRKERGGFKRVEELEEVPGIGAQTLQSLRSHVTVASNGGSGGRKAAETASETVEKGVKTAAENGGAAADKVVDMARNGAETAREAGTVQAESARRTVENTATKTMQAAEETADVQRDLIGAAREAQEVWLGLMQEQMAANVQTARRLLECRSPQQLAELQVEYLRGSMERFVHGSARIGAPASQLFGGMWSSPAAWQNLAPWR